MSILKGLIEKKDNLVEQNKNETGGFKDVRQEKRSVIASDTNVVNIKNSLFGEIISRGKNIEDSVIEEDNKVIEEDNKVNKVENKITVKKNETQNDTTGEILGKVSKRIGMTKEMENEVGNKMRKLFNQNLQILSGYLNKEFVYIPEKFIFLYSDDIIYYGDELTRTPVGVQVADLMVGIITDILGFHNIWLTVYNNKQLTTKYQQIINHQIYHLHQYYILNVLDYHNKTFAIPADIAVKTKEILLKTVESSFLPSSLLKSSVYRNYENIVKQVGEHFNISTRTFDFPVMTSLMVTERSVKFDYNLVTELEDIGMEFYAEKLKRYQDYGKSNNFDDNKMTRTGDSEVNGDANDTKDKSTSMDGVGSSDETLKQILKDKTAEFNGRIEGNFSLTEDNMVTPQYLTVEKEINHEWKTRLREWVNYYKPKKINSYMTPNKKLLYTGMILSSPMEAKGAKDLKGVCIYIDTSTSIDLEKINHAMITLRSILEGYKGDIKIKTFTTEVKESKITLNTMRNNKVRLDLGGGTDIGVVLKDIENERLRNYINIIITDGELDWNVIGTMKRNNYKLAFLITKSIDTTNLPKGRNIKIYEVT